MEGRKEGREGSGREKRIFESPLCAKHCVKGFYVHYLIPEEREEEKPVLLNSFVKTSFVNWALN